MRGVRLRPASTRARAGSWLCMVVHDYYPLDGRVVREAKAAAQMGYRVDVICPTDVGQLRREVIDGINVHRIGITRNRGAGLLAMLREYAQFALRASVAAARLSIRNRGVPERVVQVHAPPDFLIVAGVVPKLLGTRLILDIHDLSRHLYLARFADRRASFAINRVMALTERAACAIADQVITVHEPYRRELIANGVAESRIEVVMNAVDDDLISEASLAATRPQAVAGRQRVRSPAAPFTIAYHGTITPSYGVGLIIEALPHVLEQIPAVRCMILGGGDALAAAQARARELGVADVIEFSGEFLPIETALSRVATADCGLIPNLPSELNRFALSSKLFEYVALGLPAVVARLETLMAHFGADEVTFFEAGDAMALARAVIWVATNPDEAQARAARALARNSDYAWAQQRARYLGLLGAVNGHTEPSVRAPLMTTGDRRFAFGANWISFLSVVGEERIRAAEKSLAEMLGWDDLSGMTFLDIGCGSGLFSLAAVRLGAARVRSFDFDPQSVTATRRLREQYAPNADRWTVEQGSIVDPGYVEQLGQWDIVYSWGVLHHTGEMDQALANAGEMVAPGGVLFIAIYNDQGWKSQAWRRVKRICSSLPAPLQRPYAALVYLPFELRGVVASVARRDPQRYWRRWTEYARDGRGMSHWHDVLDWVGGYPFEVATPERIFEFYRRRGFALERLTTKGADLGCNEYVFSRAAPTPPEVEAARPDAAHELVAQER